MKTIKLLLTLALLSCQPAYADRILSGDIVEGVVTQKNYLGNKGHFEKNAAGWIGYDDAAAAPVDGTGGTVTTTCTRTTTTPLSGDGSFLYTPGALGEGCAATFTIDSKDKGRVLQLSFDYSVVSGTYTDDDTTIWIYDTSTPALIQPAPYKIKKTGTTEKFVVEFQTSSASTAYRILIHQATAGTAVLKFDNFQLGPQAKLYGSSVTDWISYTPTSSWVSNTTHSGYYRRVGDSAEIQVKLVLTGAPTSATLTVNLPSGLTIDTNKLLNLTAATGGVIGIGRMYDNGTQLYSAEVVYNSTTSVGLLAPNATSTNVTDSASVTQAVPFTFGSTDEIQFFYKVPIVGWSSSQIMSSDASTRVVAARYGSTQTTSITTAFVLIDYDALSHDDTGSVTTGASWKFTAKSPGIYRVSASMYLASVNLSTTQACGVWVYKNGSAAGELGRQAGVGVARNYVVGGSTNIKLVAGDYISIYGFSDVTTNMGSNAGLSHVSIEKIQGPAQILASDSVSALYTGTPPTGTLNGSYNIVTYGTKVKDTHNAYSSGSYTVPVSGTYSISAGTGQAATYALGNSAASVIYIDGTIAHGFNAISAAGAVGQIYTSGTVFSIPLLAGQVVSIRALNQGTTPTYIANAFQNWFSIVRTGNY